MSQFTGFATAAAQLGLQNVMIKPQRGIYFPNALGSGPPQTIIAQAVIEEVGNDQMEITEHPVEQGSMISDHAFARPVEVVVHYGWSDSPSVAGFFQGAVAGLAQTANLPSSILAGNSQAQMTAIYKQLIKLKDDRTLFTLYTGKRKYQNMLIRSLTNHTDHRTEHSLSMTIICKQIIFAQTRVVTLGVASVLNLADPASTPNVLDVGVSALADAPALASTMTAATSAAGTIGDTLSGALSSTAATLSSTAEAAVTAINNTVSATVNALPGVMDTFNTQLTNAANSLTGALAGAAGELPGIVNNAMATLQDAIATVGTPFEVPVIPATPQTFSITIGPGPVQ